MTRIEVDQMQSDGFNCCQIVFAQGCRASGMNPEEALKIGAAFGGGMRRGGTCGCVTGALMALGLKYGHSKPGDHEAKQKTAEKSAQFEAMFLDEYESLLCREILGYDFSIPEERAAAVEKGLLQERCPEIMTAACRMLDEIFE